MKSFRLEAIIWLSALIYLVVTNPYADSHYNLCLFNQLGIDFCPGCGLGRAISMLLHGDIINSIKMHPLGIFGFLMIIHRISILTLYSIEKKTLNKEEG